MLYIHYNYFYYNLKCKSKEVSFQIISNTSYIVYPTGFLYNYFYYSLCCIFNRHSIHLFLLQSVLYGQQAFTAIVSIKTTM